MDTVKIKKAELLRVITENKKKYDAVFAEAVADYWEDVKQKLMAYQAAVDAKERNLPSVAVPYPEDHSEAYLTVLAMLELCVDEIIELNRHEFDAYVRNRWGWREQFLNTVTSYSNYKQGAVGGARQIRKAAVDF